MWSHVADAVWARVGATIRATSRNAPSVLAISLRIVDPQSHAAVHASSEGTSGYGVERTDRTRVDYRKYCLNVARDRLSVRWCRLGRAASVVPSRWCGLGALLTCTRQNGSFGPVDPRPAVPRHSFHPAPSVGRDEQLAGEEGSRRCSGRNRAFVSLESTSAGCWGAGPNEPPGRRAPGRRIARWATPERGHSRRRIRPEWPERQLAERLGFEPREGLHPLRFSRPPHSTALPPLRSARIPRSELVRPAGRA
jgi:hypothetical protein